MVFHSREHRVRGHQEGGSTPLNVHMPIHIGFPGAHDGGSVIPWSSKEDHAKVAHKDSNCKLPGPHI